MSTTQELLFDAIRHHQQGELSLAESIYRQILQRDPLNADALHLLGVIANQCEQPQIAIDLIRQAIQILPGNAPFYSNLGLALLKAGELSDAVSAYSQALVINPSLTDAYNGLGLTYRAQRNLESAIHSFQQAIVVSPGQADAHCNLGIVFHELGRPNEAIQALQQAINLQPRLAEAYHNLGNVFKSLWRVDLARKAYEDAVALKPNYADAIINLGNILHEQGQLENAKSVFQNACQIAPRSSDAFYNLGITLSELKCPAEATVAYQTALSINPQRIDALGSLLMERQHACDWNDLDRLTDEMVETVERSSPGDKEPSIAPFTFIALPKPISPELQFRCARRWSKTALSIPPGVATLDIRSVSQRKRGRLRIAYLSADFRRHAVAYMLPELLEEHDRDQFEVYGYSLGPNDGSSIRQRIVEAVDHFRDVRSLSFIDIARQIAADEIDILIDLQGHTLYAQAKLLALRPAPIQVSYIGFPGTMGADFIDYILVDSFVAPPEHQPFYTERLVHLPGCYQVNDSRHEISSKSYLRSECGLPDDGFVFCSFNNSFKLTPATFDVWMRLLTSIPQSILWLPEWQPTTKANLRREAARRHVDPDRLVFAKILPIAEHLARHRLADLFLDSFPYSGHATASISLRMGVPIVTLVGDAMASRVAGSLLHAVGLPELITNNFDEYEALARKLATNPLDLQAIKSRLASNLPKCDLFNGAVFAKNVERAYLAMWEQCKSGARPMPINLTAASRTAL
ncbi:MAG: tetratricopeptide repeat protein [Pirellulaceae bacterium]|nr:tetratricopeptide repeat protein [Pirellulaceae bacterium]